jgi:serine/threonine-protein kinase
VSGQHDPDGAIPVGERFGDYLVTGVLGEGGVGKVYRAVDGSGREVALKVVKPALADDMTFRRRFSREARIAQGIEHDHVVPVLEAGEHDGTPYMVQKLIGGGTLARRVEHEGRLDVATTVRICRQVASGLDALHAAGVVHRDVKPANILLDAATGETPGNAYIADFGLVKPQDGTLLTAAGQALGTIDYIAPEQIRADAVTPATDVYALACVVYTCLVGAPPFADRRGMKVLWAHLQDPPTDPASRAPDVPPDVGHAVLMALAKDPNRRPQSAGMFGQLLRLGARLD